MAVDYLTRDGDMLDDTGAVVLGLEQHAQGVAQQAPGEGQASGADLRRGGEPQYHRIPVVRI